MHLLGYSFGAAVCGGAIDKREFIATYVAVAYPLGHWFSRGALGVGAKISRAHARAQGVHQAQAVSDRQQGRLHLAGRDGALRGEVRGAVAGEDARGLRPLRVRVRAVARRRGARRATFFRSTGAYVDATLEGAEKVKAARVSGGEKGEWFHTAATPVRVARPETESAWDEVFEDAASPGADG